MNILIKETVCDRNNLSLNEVLLLCLYANRGNPFELKDTLMNKGLLSPTLFDIDDLEISNIGIDTLRKILPGCKIIPDDFDYSGCAIAMRELFPKGMKVINGMKYPWKCNKTDVEKALMWFRESYKGDDGKPYTYEQIIDATKRYIDSFNGMFEDSRMRTIRNFIKLQTTEHDDEGVGHHVYKSDLASWIENDYVEADQEYNGRIIYG